MRFPVFFFYDTCLTAMRTVVPRLHLGGLICCFLSVFCSEAFERVVFYCIYSGHERTSFIFSHFPSNDKLNTDYSSVIEIQSRIILHNVHVIAICPQTIVGFPPYEELETSILKFPMNTTRTAQYAAVPAKSSARLAFVRRPIAAENKSAKTIKRKILRYVLERVRISVTRYMMNMGTANKRMITNATIRTARASTRATLK